MNISELQVSKLVSLLPRQALTVLLGNEADGPLTPSEVELAFSANGLEPQLAEITSGAKSDGCQGLVDYFANLRQANAELQPANLAEQIQKESFLRLLINGMTPNEQAEKALSVLVNENFSEGSLGIKLAARVRLSDYLEETDGRGRKAFKEDLMGIEEFVQRLQENPYDCEAARMVGGLVLETPYFLGGKSPLADADLVDQVKLIYSVLPILSDKIREIKEADSLESARSRQPPSQAPQSDSKIPLIGVLGSALVAAIRFIFSGQKSTDFFSSLGMLQIGTHIGGAIKSNQEGGSAGGKRAWIQSGIGFVISAISYYISQNKITGAIMPLFTGLAGGFLGWMSDGARTAAGVPNE